MMSQQKNFLPLFLLISMTSVVILISSASVILKRENESDSYQKKNQNNIHDLDKYSKIFKNGNDITSIQKMVDILHYDLFFDLYPEKKQFNSSANIKGVLLENGMKKITLNFYDNFDISSVKLNGKEQKYLYENNLLVVLSDKSFQSDTFNLEINYSGRPKRAGFSGFAFGEINGKSLVYTLSEPDYASSWFPCNDYPSDKALLDVRIRNDSSQISVSNGILVDIVNEGKRRTYHWKTNYPISTYLVAVYSSSYEHFSDKYISLDEQDTMAIDYYVLPDDLKKAKIDFEQHPDMIRFFAETFGEYPFIKEKYGVAEFLWQLGAMEHQTITGVASNMVTGKNYYLDTYAHELAHHWWGDAIGPKSWKDIWLNEGFSSYSEALFYEFRSGKSALQSTMLSKKSDNFTGSLSEPGAFLFTRTVYDKGAWVLHMLRWELGDIGFFKILREYFEKYKYSNASTQDFIDICEEVSGSDLSDFFDQWLKGIGIIELEYEWETKKTTEEFETTIYITQKQSGYGNYSFPLEILLNFKDQKSESFKHRITAIDSRIKINSKEKPLDIVLDPNNWLLMKSAGFFDD